MRWEDYLGFFKWARFHQSVLVTGRQRGCEDGSRGWGEAVMNQGTPQPVQAAKGKKGIFP